MQLRCFITVLLAVVLFSRYSSSAVFTVAKSGGQYTSIQEAVNAAGAGDEVVILDTAVYEEQVTIDSSKSGLTLRSEKPLLRAKPVILYKDTLNVGPTNAVDARNREKITFDRNGALRVIGATRIRIEGIAIDGGGVYPFGSKAVWEGRYDLQHGNTALVLLLSGEVIVRNCDIRNAYFGIYFKDRNEGGIFANPNPADVAPESVIPFSRFNRTGNHLLEYSRVHNNSCGIFYESTWDGGTTIRYNLIYENHHPSAAIVTKVKGLTLSEGPNQSGGAFMFKDHIVSPIAIYNNTLWHNSVLFLGNWKSGGQHLVFNNIFSGPNEYWQGSTTTFSTTFDMSKAFLNRMHNCVYAVQLQEPVSSYTTITYDLKPVLTVGSYTEGSLVFPYPATAEIRWLETSFLSTDPQSELFLMPDWSDPQVQEYILDKGWEEAGVKDPDGTRADLGAIPKAGGRYQDVVVIRPSAPVTISGTTATVSFSIAPRIGSMTDLKVAMFGIVCNLDTSNIFGAYYKPIIPANITPVSLGTQTVTMGSNRLSVEVPAAGDFAFFEMFVEGTGSNGMTITTPAGFIPYHKFDQYLEVVVLDKSGGSPVTEVQAGQKVVVRVTATKGGDAFTDTINPTVVGLLSGCILKGPGGAVVNTVDGGITGTAEMEVVFTIVPQGGVEYVTAAGRWIDAFKVVSFIGCSDGITVHPDPTVVRLSRSELAVSAPAIVELVDLRGRVVRRVTAGNARSLTRGAAVFPGASAGMYLMRMKDAATGRVSLQKRMVVGR